MLVREEILRESFGKHILPLKKPTIDLIAVTYGPGLAPALWTGVNFAKALSSLWHLPLLPINHMEGHIFSSLIEQKKNTNKYSSRRKVGTPTETSELTAIHYPAIALLVSGGHTELHLIKKLGNHKRLGETLDDASGEAFDKVAKMLGLKYPGGPEISKQAEMGNPRAISFPRPMLKADNFDFSFSGLKTSVLYYLRDNEQLLSSTGTGHLFVPATKSSLDSRASAEPSPQRSETFRTKTTATLADVAASFEQAVVDVLVEKTLRAAKKYKAKTILIGGGVAANKKLRATLSVRIKKELPRALFLTPQISQTGDNALMIALAAVYGEHFDFAQRKHSRTTFSPNKKAPKKFGAEPGLRL
jgi:N6-L-threonylcarbamoyladenine synthase